jgi:hypothetical protein
LLSTLAANGVPAHGVSGLNVWIPVAHEALVTRRLLDGGFAVAAGERFRLHAAPAIRITTADLQPGEAEQIADLLATDTRALRTHPRDPPASPRQVDSGTPFQGAFAAFHQTARSATRWAAVLRG